MLTLLTSSGRYDLLEKTLRSFFHKQQTYIDLIIHEDSDTNEKIIVPRYPGLRRESTIYIKGKNQHASIEKFLAYEFRTVTDRDEKYYLHLEDDWEFENIYDWIKESIKIMEQDDSIIKVLARQDIAHGNLTPVLGKNYSILEPWASDDSIVWHGFGWNPGLTRIDLLKRFLPFPEKEQHLSEKIYEAGYKTVQLNKPVYKHIGEGRSTHE